ncbi:MAG: YceI family protein [Rhodothermales bacterium]|nr:YceI family protein [Rhodothermales bacterium]
MKTVATTLILTCLLLMDSGVAAHAQSHMLSSDSKLWVEGTSNKSDWTVTATELLGTAQLDENGEVGTLTLEVPSAKLLSQKSSIMDRLMHKTLDVAQHPMVVFELASLSPVEAGDGAVAAGQLTIAGVTKDVDVEVSRVESDDGATRYTGSHALKMTDYGMKPPSAMFGALHTGDDVTVRFDIGLVPSEAGS